MRLQAIHSIKCDGKKYAPGAPLTVSDEIGMGLVEKGAATIIEIEEKGGEDESRTEKTVDRKSAAEDKKPDSEQSDAGSGDGNGDATESDTKNVEQPDDLTVIKGIGPELAASLKDRFNISTFQQLAEADIEAIKIIPGLGAKKCKKIIEAAVEILDENNGFSV